jgi:hypothetical protein
MVCPKCGATIDMNNPIAAQLAMKFHRKFKCGKVSKMSIMENAQQLASMAEGVATDAIGVNTVAGESVNETVQKLEQVRQAIEETSQTAAVLLGENHPGVGAVTGSASVVTEKIQDLIGMAHSLQENITALDQLILAHSTAMKEAAQRAMGQS